MVDWGMPFKKGNTFAAGRPKGAKNRIPSVIEALQKRTFNPLDKLIDLYYEAEAKENMEMREKILSNINRFIYAMPKHVIHEGDIQVSNTTEVISTQRNLVQLVLSNPTIRDAIQALEEKMQSKDIELLPTTETE